MIEKEQQLLARVLDLFANDLTKGRCCVVVWCCACWDRPD